MASVDMQIVSPRTIKRSHSSRRIWRRYAPEILTTGLLVVDGLSIIGAGCLVDGFILRRSALFADFAEVALVAFIFYALVNRWFGGYSVSGGVGVAARCGKAVGAWVVSLLLLFLAAFMFKVGDQYSRLGACIFALAGLGGLSVANLVVTRFIVEQLRRGRLAFGRVQTITLESLTGSRLPAWTPPLGLDVTANHAIAISSPDFEDRCRSVRDVLQRQIAAGNCDQVFISASWRDRDHVEALLREFGPLPAPVLLLSDPSLSELCRQRRVILGDRVGFELQSAPLSQLDRGAKRILDVCVASAAIALLSPLMLLASVAIVLESGFPIVFRQDRRGFGGIPFKILKFRSMTVVENGADVPQAKRNDARVTLVGRILRRSSIDELPQLFNVLKGEMSIVGPRPHAMAHDDYYDGLIETYAFRHHVKPGITGWAQVNGLRGATEAPGAMRARVEHDLWYINHWSLWLDIWIIFKTAFKVLADDNAY